VAGCWQASTGGDAAGQPTWRRLFGQPAGLFRQDLVNEVAGLLSYAFLVTATHPTSRLNFF